MKTILIGLMVGLSAIFAEATWAACTAATQVTDAQAALSGKTACAGSAPTFDAQELHQANGALIDYKRGSNDPVDPTEQVGTWSATGGTVTYNYNGGGSFTFSVHDNGNGTFDICDNGSLQATASLKTNGNCAN